MKRASLYCLCAVTAEGVEEADQQAFLCNEGCNLVQGYVICRPGPPEKIERWIRERSGGNGSSS